MPSRSSYTFNGITPASRRSPNTEDRILRQRASASNRVSNARLIYSNRGSSRQSPSVSTSSYDALDADIRRSQRLRR
jgi:hypothetical protein